jgi:hypothetical protein
MGQDLIWTMRTEGNISVTSGAKNGITAARLTIIPLSIPYAAVQQANPICPQTIDFLKL